MRAGMRGLAAMLVGLAAGAAGAPSAWAGTYDVVACNAPGARGVNSSWSWSVGALGTGANADDPTHYALTGNCASPTGLSGTSNPQAPPVRWGTFANFAFTAPAGTDIRRVVLWRYGTGTAGTDDPNTPNNESGRWEVNAQFDGNSLFADTCHPGEGIWPNPCHTGSTGFSSASRVVHDGRGQTFTVGIFCGGTNGPFIACSTADGAGNPLGALNFQGATVTLGDTSAPKLTVGGTLFSAGWRHPSDLATFNTSDNSGIKQARLEADGTVLQNTAYPCDPTRPIPCRPAVAGRLNPRGITDGTHTLRVVTVDAAGNGGVAQRRVQLDGTPPTATLQRASHKTIVIAVSDATSGVAAAGLEVRNGSKEPYRTLAGTLAAGKLRATLDRGSASHIDTRVMVSDVAGNVTQGNPTRLAVTSAKFGRHSRRVRSNRVKVPYGRHATLHGRLTLSGGQPLVAQTIGLASTVRRRGARTRLLGARKTNSHGHFSIRIPAGPSRTLRVAFAGGGGALGISREISYRVPASSTIHASRTRLFGSGRVRFNGRLRTRGQSVPGRGLVLVLQGRERGRWRTFDDARTDGKGRWHATYEFSGRAGRYPIHVRIRRQTSYPFELGYSRSLVIRVG